MTQENKEHDGNLRHFKINEFVCGCGCGFVKMSGELLLMLDEARQLSGRPYVINSGYRCEPHNQAVGGSPTSSHLGGLAVDISCPDDRARGALLAGLIGVGFRRIGIAKTYIHVDIDPGKAGAVWLYE